MPAHIHAAGDSTLTLLFIFSSFPHQDQIVSIITSRCRKVTTRKATLTTLRLSASRAQTATTIRTQMDHTTIRTPPGAMALHLVAGVGSLTSWLTFQPWKSRKGHKPPWIRRIYLRAGTLMARHTTTVARGALPTLHRPATPTHTAQTNEARVREDLELYFKNWNCFAGRCHV
jgi:hypothetical protein